VHCHIGIIARRFSLAAGQAFIGHIAIWILLVILPFGNHWQYCHLVSSARIMLSAICAGESYWSYWQYCHGNLIAPALRPWYYKPYIYIFILITNNKWQYCQ
jgi:hypothetical protein